VSIVRLLDARGPRTVAACVLAIVLWCGFIGFFLHGLPDTPPPAARPLTLDARLVEIAPPPPPPPPAPAHLAPAPAPAAKRAVPHVTARPRPAHTAPAPVRPPAPVPEPPVARAESPVPAPIAAPPATTAAASPGVRAPSATSSSSTGRPAGVGSADAGDAAAHPLIQPLPVLPDDLREFAYRAVALARFTIHPDGTVDVVLVKPTQNPRLNQLLLETLHHWRFFPAMKDGHPVESTRDIRVHFNVG